MKFDQNLFLPDFISGKLGLQIRVQHNQMNFFLIPNNTVSFLWGSFSRFLFEFGTDMGYTKQLAYKAI